MLNIRSILVLLLFSTSAWAEETAPAATEAATATPPPVVEPSVYVKKVKGDFSATYKTVFTALENNGYFVVFEPNIGKNLSHFAQRWGKNYNKNDLEAIRSIVFCNAWYANEVSNMDPDMLALCPLHVTLVQKKGVTSILFLRPSQVALDSPAIKVVTELELDVIRAIEQGFIP